MMNNLTYVKNVYLVFLITTLLSSSLGSPFFVLAQTTGDQGTLEPPPPLNTAATLDPSGESDTFTDPTRDNRHLSPDSCWNEDSWGDTLTCYFRSFLALIGSIPASIGAWTLTLAGTLFNFLVENTIINFKEAIIDKIGDGINIAWTAFRDIANIVIIGMFVFIAVNIILGVKQFGDRKKVAHVLIVAVLINFSLLFTKVIIDASHFTAFQLYRAAESIQTGAENSSIFISNPGASSGTAPGLAGSFLTTMGITSAGNVYDAVWQVAENQQNGWIAILYGLFTGTLFFAAAIVLLYGSFLLASRAVLLIFLLITSPLAFASWLIPQSSIGANFSTWWDSLLKAAFFAPLLMVFLWAALLVANGIKASSGSLGSLVSDPKAPFGLDALFSYLIILGMLYGAFKLSSKLSGAIPGMNLSSILTAAPLALGARLGGAALSYPINRWAFSRQGKYADRAQHEGKQAVEARGAARDLKDAGFDALAAREEKKARTHERAAAQAGRALQRRSALADTRLNVMDTKFGKAVMQKAGVSGFAAGQSGKDARGYASRVEERAKSVQKIAEKTAPSKDTIADEKKRYQKTREDEHLRREREQDNMKRLEAAIRESAETERSLLNNQHKSATEQLARANMSGEKARIESAKAEVDRIAGEIRGLSTKKRAVTYRDADGETKAEELSHGEARGKLEQATKDLTTYAKETNKRLQGIEDAAKDVGINVAQELGKREGTWAQRAVGTLTGTQRNVGAESGDQFKKRLGNKRVRSLLESMKESGELDSGKKDSA